MKAAVDTSISSGIGLATAAMLVRPWSSPVEAFDDQSVLTLVESEIVYVDGSNSEIPYPATFAFDRKKN
jgi:hypothetical protein